MLGIARRAGYPPPDQGNYKQIIYAKLIKKNSQENLLSIRKGG